MVDEKALGAACDAVLLDWFDNRPEPHEVRRVVVESAVRAYLKALAPPRMVKLSPEDERLLEKALNASSPAIYEVVPAPLSPGSTGDWVLVPKEPTREMLNAMAFYHIQHAGAAGAVEISLARSSYRAMLSAAGER